MSFLINRIFPNMNALNGGLPKGVIPFDNPDVSRMGATPQNDGTAKPQAESQTPQPVSVFSTFDGDSNNNVDYSEAKSNSLFDKAISESEFKAQVTGNYTDAQKSQITTNAKSAIGNLQNIFDGVASKFNFKYDKISFTPKEANDDVSNLVNAEREKIDGDARFEAFKTSAEANSAIQDAYAKALSDAQAAFDKEQMPPEDKLKEKTDINVTNQFNQNGSIQGKVTVNKDDKTGDITSVSVISDKSGETYTYKRQDDGTFAEVDKNGKIVSDRQGNQKIYSLGDDGNLVRTNSSIKVDGKTYKKVSGNVYMQGGKFFTTSDGKNLKESSVSDLPALDPKKGLTETLGDQVPKINPSEIKVNIPNKVKHAQTRSGLEKAGAKFIQREVNGEKQEIAVLTDKSGHKTRVMVNPDGTTEELVATDTTGKNKYKTKTEANKDLTTMFGNQVGNTLIKAGATPKYEDGKIVGVTVNGKTMAGSELNRFVKGQLNAQSSGNNRFKFDTNVKLGLGNTQTPNIFTDPVKLNMPKNTNLDNRFGSHDSMPNRFNMPDLSSMFSNVAGASDNQGSVSKETKTYSSKDNINDVLKGLFKNPNMSGINDTLKNNIKVDIQSQLAKGDQTADDIKAKLKKDFPGLEQLFV